MHWKQLYIFFHDETLFDKNDTADEILKNYLFGETENTMKSVINNEASVRFNAVINVNINDIFQRLHSYVWIEKWGNITNKKKSIKSFLFFL